MIEAPGIFPDLAMAEYLADPCPVPSLSASCALRLITRSPLHAWQEHPRLGGVKGEDAGVADIGSVAHDLLLGGEGKIAVIDPAEYRSKPTKDSPDGNIPIGWTNTAIREARDSARSRGLTPILLEDFSEVQRMNDAAREFIATSEIAGVFETGAAEQTVVWREGDAWCRARPDWLNGTTCLHYKTTEASAEPAAFIRGIMRSMGYGFAMAFYARGLSVIAPSVDRHVILIQEQTAPYACSLISLIPSKWEIEFSSVTRAIKLWSQCMWSSKWPGYSGRIHYAEPTAWELAESEYARIQDIEADAKRIIHETFGPTP